MFQARSSPSIHASIAGHDFISLLGSPISESVIPSLSRDQIHWEKTYKLDGGKAMSFRDRQTFEEMKARLIPRQAWEGNGLKAK
jgi:hypothetical protein